MNRELQPPILGEMVVAALFSAVLFTILFITTGGILISLVTAAVALVVFGLFHYFLWGQALLQSTVRERQQVASRTHHAREASTPAQEVTLVLSDRERVEMINALEKSLAEAPQANEDKKATIGELLGRLRGFGV